MHRVNETYLNIKGLKSTGINNKVFLQVQVVWHSERLLAESPFYWYPAQYEHQKSINAIKESKPAFVLQ